MYNLKNIKKNTLRYLTGLDFAKGYVLALAMVLPLYVTNLFDLLPLGIAMTLGVFMVAPSDVPGNLKHRLLGMLSAIILGVLGTLLGGYSQEIFWLNLLVVFVFVFTVSLLAVYGFRASLVIFTGLISIVLSYANFGDIAIWLHAVYIALGSLWYILLSSLFLYLRPNKHTELLLGETAQLTGDFLILRGKLLSQNNDRELLKEEQHKLQVRINEKHEDLREALLSSRKASGVSNSSRRKLLIFIDLVDLLELIVAHPINYKYIDEIGEKEPSIIDKYQELIFEMSEQMFHISEVFIDNTKVSSSLNMSKPFKEIEALLVEEKSAVLDDAQFLFLQNIFDFELKQIEKINSIERVLKNINKRNKIKIQSKEEIQQFLTPIDYSFRNLTQQLSLSSPTFRHALRLALLMVIGVFIGNYFQVQNSYWILLTLIVILRPSYGLTKERSKHRIIGTLIGGAVAFIIVLFVQNPLVFMILGVICLIFAFSMIQKNYVGAAAFITLNVVFIYALMQPNILDVIQFRVIDTIIGSGLAFFGNFILWPSWESSFYKKNVVDALQANINYLKEIDRFYQNKGSLPTSYKVARKKAFIAMGNLSETFQRMAQEPKSKRKAYRRLYEYNALNYTFLSSLASLGTFIRNHKTTQASSSFDTYMEHIEANLNESIHRIEKKKVETHPVSKEDLKRASTFLENETIRLNLQYLKKENQEQQEVLQAHRKEAQLITEQLKWLYEISLNLKKVAKSKKT
ncbi:FUSC family protein [Mesonia sp.]|uniref:FUSC family protein n=1 Tax=Mesonia sp. TaxID=1960830 RepID=UPI003F986154